MRNKILVSLLSIFTLLFITAGTSSAATNIRLQQPATPTNQDTFNIVFVALDTNSGQSISVQCYKKGPTDSTFSAFGSSITLSNGGNTSSCQVNSGVMNEGNGTYQFYATATGSGSDTSQTVSVDFNNETPGTPTNYSKTQPDSCTYKISFHTANDNNETIKVVLYRSTDTSFSLDSGHQVNTLSIGSNQDGSMTDNVSPNCSTTYYYVIRAFDKYGNGSGVVGDSNVNVTNVTTNPTTTTQEGAIPVGGSGGGSVLGAKTTEEVLGTSTKSAKLTPTPTPKLQKNPVTNTVNWILTHKTNSILIIIIVLIILGAAYYAYLRSKKVK